MKTEQLMLDSVARARRAFAIVAVAMFAALTGCAGDDFRLPRPLVSPYVAERTDVLWAVAPLRNESAVSLFDPLAVSDTLVAQVEEVRGVSAVPMNRVIGAMRAIGMQSVNTPADALVLARSLGVDAIIVGSITAWNPYDPPQFGLKLALYGVSEKFGTLRPADRVDPRALTAAGTDYTLPPGPWRNQGQLASTASEHLDGANHEVQIAVRAFAEGRHQPESSLGWKRYLASMKLFTEFACYRLTERLLDAERLRLAQSVAEAPTR